jgi:hypothetical protein
MRARAGLIEAHISWDKRNDGGTVFTLKREAPLKNTRPDG